MGSPRIPIALLVTALTSACAVAPPSTPTAEESVALAADPLSPEVRVRVEALIAAGVPATTPDTASDRADLLRQWGNARALAGHTLPVDLTLAVHSFRQLVAQGDAPTEAAMAQLDRYLAELALLDREPSALGGTRFASDAELVSSSWTTLEQIYTIGSRPPRRGAVFVLGAHFMSDHGLLQFEDPAGANYVTARSSRAGATFEAFRLPWTSMHAGAGRSSPVIAYRLGGADLEAGDTVTFIYGDRGSGSRGFEVQSFATRRFTLPIYVDLDGGGKFFSPSWDTLAVVGQPELAALDVFAPPVVRPGETFALAIRAADAFFNRPTGAIPAWEVRLDGRTVASVAAGGPAVTEVAGLTLSTPGVSRFEVRSADGRFAVRSNPVWVREKGSPLILFGELHGHTDFAEAQGSPEEYFDYGAQDARLDFMALTEHDSWLDAAEWRTLQELAKRTNAEGRVIAFLAYEWTAQRSTGGHHNVIFRNGDTEMVPFSVAPTLPELYRGLHAEVAPDDVVVIPHAHTAGDWTQSDPELERLVELYSMHGTFEWFANLYLQNGWEVGFVAGSDDHRAKPGLARSSHVETLGQRGGLAAVIVAEKTPDAIFDGLRHLSSYATSGQRILLDAELNGFGMGTRQPAAAERRLRARVAGTAPIDRIDVVKNGEIVLSRNYLSAPLAERVWVQIGFESSSEVFPPERDNPRLYRVWEGSLEIAGAEIRALDDSGVDNRYTESVARDPIAAGRIRYHVETRGRRDVFLVELDSADADTALTFDIGPGREIGVASGLARPPAQNIPAERFAVRLGDLRDGRFEQEASFERYDDRVTVQLVDPGASLDREIEWVDLAGADPGRDGGDSGEGDGGDYYYLRVNQLDGSRAWSSPWWVGGRAAESRSLVSAPEKR